MKDSTNQVPARLSALREAMQRHGIDALMVPSADPHLSEYLPARWKGREWLSGFTGSVGTFIITAGFAGVWTDGRYWTQAESELAGSGVQLMKITSGASVQYVDWLAETMRAGQTVAVDGAVLGLAIARLLQAALGARGVQLRTDIDVLDEVWSGRAGLPDEAVYEHLPPYASKGRATKLVELRADMARAGASHHVISTLDDIAYLFNLRGSDVSFNPIFLAHALVEAQQAQLFVAEGKIAADLAGALAADGIHVRPYAQAGVALAALPQEAVLLLDPRRITYGTRQAVPAGVRVIEAVNPTTFAKSRKTGTEADHVRATMEQDGAALAEFFCWLEGALARREKLNEYDIGDHLLGFRKRRPGFVSPSFGTIAGFRANGAIMHYRAAETGSAQIEGDGLLLIDSGGQYVGGTTDITRVVGVGSITPQEKRDFTLVLKGMMALSVAHFPRGCKSPMLDAIARAPIWAAGIDFGHGTGHGVGYFLNVHEGPQSISPSTPPDAHTAMEPGMITSNEPGIYRPGKWGIRIENLVLNVPAGSQESGFGEFLRFETLTLCPIDTRLIERSLLRADEIAWLNAYHAMVRERVAPLVGCDALVWLEERTAAI